MSSPRILVIGYGNPGREDDGLGSAAAAAIEAMGLPGVDVEEDYQLNIEYGAMAGDYDIVLFVDASKTAQLPYELKRIAPAAEVAFSTHAVSPESVMAVCDDHFGPAPEAWVLGIRGHSWEFREGLTDQARQNLDKALEDIRPVILAWKEQTMAENTGKKTILTIDDDPDIRQALRICLEAEGYAVGEAGDGEEGLKAVERVKPDAVIVDLMMEDVDAGADVARKLKESGFSGPVYMLSSAGDAVRYNIDQRELGLAGIFQKPIDPKTLAATLKSKLKG